MSDFTMASLRSQLFPGSSAGSSSSSLYSLVALGSALAAGMLYVVFGPDDGGGGDGRRRQQQRRRQRQRGYPPGMRNVGNYCFVNATLQALASCRNFVEWLDVSCGAPQNISPLSASATSAGGAVTSALLGTLLSLNNEGVGEDDLVTPNAVLGALRSHGWRIDTDEQDAHEMLNVLLTSLEEEAQKCTETVASKTASLSFYDDIIGGDNIDDDVEDDDDDGPQYVGEEGEGARSRVSPSPPPATTPGGTLKRHRRSSSGVFSRGGDELSLLSVRSQTRSSQRKKNALTPFSGTITNKISYVNQPENEADEDEASDSKKKKGDNPVSATTFNNITLSLPRVALVLTHSSLGLETLLQMYVSREPVSQSSTEKSPIILKQLTFGRLPQCLCLHVQRTAYDPALGRATKRTDHVAFPDELDMERYAFASQALRAQELERRSREWLREKEREAPAAGEVKLPSLPTTTTGRAKSEAPTPYLIRAVIVHLGAVNSGHYVTYRKGPADKWFLTSDEKVEEIEESQVKAANAYMLFYERQQPSSSSSVMMRPLSPD